MMLAAGFMSTQQRRSPRLPTSTVAGMAVTSTALGHGVIVAGEPGSACGATQP